MSNEKAPMQPMSWVHKCAPVTHAGELNLLYALADYAKADGTCAWPSQAKLAADCGVTVRSVGRYLSSLESKGVIRRGDQEAASCVDSAHRPVVWDLAMDVFFGAF